VARADRSAIGPTGGALPGILLSGRPPVNPAGRYLLTLNRLVEPAHAW